MEEQQCRNCAYFCQHYMPCRSGGFIPVEFVHCIYGNTKMCRACRKACKYFLPKEQDQ